ncbi:beta-ketoacyl-[acyl-carrier-protein] synthase family protein [Candidatus Magnetominusculus xianensis]|nr:beta-ketoacyl-[acyl-carrier-protein] synthase family protein [Candidatus Magnetominusculus xianensis]MBF0405183.1 beta-ketoacyl-[acyl-carrier-protein] synthase family protein [Nitrospirota bacterium]
MRPSANKRVVVTGLGMVTALGLEVSDNWGKALAGVSGVSRISLPGTATSPVQAVAAVNETDWGRIAGEFPEEPASPVEQERRTMFTLWAVKKAIIDARLFNSGGCRERFGTVLAAGLGINRLEDIARWSHAGEFDLSAFSREYHQVCSDSIIRNNSHRAAAVAAKRFSLFGPNATITTACASATQAIGTAFRMIRDGEADVIAAGGADSMINPIGLVFFVLLQAACPGSENVMQLCRPFDRKRSGLIMGEGAGIVILEEYEHAVKRGARIYAEAAGYASTMDAYQVTAPIPDGSGAEGAMRTALKDAALGTDAIDYINAHGTSTKLNDEAETAAITKVFKERAVAISSSKSMIGHLLAASGGPEFIFTVLSVANDEIHPTINLTNPDPKCPLDYVPLVKRSKTVRAAISNSFGFGGQNASIIVKKLGA